MSRSQRHDWRFSICHSKANLRFARRNGAIRPVAELLLSGQTYPTATFLRDNAG